MIAVHRTGNAQISPSWTKRSAMRRKKPTLSVLNWRKVCQHVPHLVLAKGKLRLEIQTAKTLTEKENTNKTNSISSEDDEVGFSCKFDECPESKEEPKPDCAYQFTIDSCCSTKIECDKEKLDKLPKCWMDGHQFISGNLIYPQASPCHKCICDEKFDNKTAPAENPNCKPVQCGFEEFQLNYIQSGCIPVYFNDGLCCSFEFRCRKYHPSEEVSFLVPRDAWTILMMKNSFF